MNNQETSKFISAFFSGLSNANIIFCILRGYEELPAIAGCDIDIFVKNLPDIHKKIETVIHSCGWGGTLIRNYDGFMTFICHHCTDDNVSTIQLDFWTSLNWRGICWCSSEELLSDMRVVNGFYVPAKGAEAVVTSVKELMGRGNVKEKYYDIISRFASEDAEKYVRCLRPAFGDIAEQLCAYCKAADFSSMNRASKALKKKLRSRNRWYYFANSLRRLNKRVASFFKPSGKLIAFVGPDGSGKTTIIEKQVEYLKPFFTDIRTYHIRYNILPELRTGHGFSSMNGKIASHTALHEEKMTIQKRTLISVLSSWFVVAYYTFEYVLGNWIVSNLNRNNTLVLFDRYYYDHFTQSTTRDLIYPFRHLLLRIVRKPDIVFHLYADSEVIYKRKQELKMEEIKAQNWYIERLLRDINNAYTLNTSQKNADVIGKEVFCIIVDKIGQNLT